MSAFLSIIVRGPGQNFSASASALSDTFVVIVNKSLISAICIISGLSDGLPFASYIFIDDSLLSPSPPSPYTVSVGKATSPPFLIISPALVIASLEISSIFSSINSVFILVVL